MVPLLFLCLLWHGILINWGFVYYYPALYFAIIGSLSVFPLFFFSSWANLEICMTPQSHVACAEWQYINWGNHHTVTYIMHTNYVWHTLLVQHCVNFCTDDPNRLDLKCKVNNTDQILMDRQMHFKLQRVWFHCIDCIAASVCFCFTNSTHPLIGCCKSAWFPPSHVIYKKSSFGTLGWNENSLL